MDPKALGERVRELRLRRKLTQASLAQKAHIAENTLRALEKGTLQTRRAIYLKVVAALDTTPEALEHAMDPITESHPLLAGLNEDDLRIAQAYSRARTILRIQVERLLLSPAAAMDPGFAELYDLYKVLDVRRQETLRVTAAAHVKAQTEAHQRRKTARTPKQS